MPYKDGSKWRAKVTYQGRRYTAKFPTKGEAKEWEHGQRDRLRRMSRTQTGMDMLMYCNKYTDFSCRHYSPKTAQEKQALCERILKEWGNITPESVTRDMILDYLEKQATLRSANAYNKDRKNLMSMFGHGVKFSGLRLNPVVGIPKLRHDRAVQYVPPTEDVLKVLAVATREEQVLLDSYLNTAARRSEVFRWQWHQDINFDKSQVRLGTRKTSDGSMDYEWVPMTDALYNSLWWWWNNRPVKGTPYVFVCTQPGRWYGKPYTERRRFMAGLCKRAAVQPFGFHALRRYVASYLADEKKVSAKRIQRILRHKNVSTTERYIKNLNNDLRETYDLLDFYGEKTKIKGTGAGHLKKGVAP